MKQCSKCAIVKAYKEYNKGRSKSGLRAECKACQSLTNKRWRSANPDSCKARAEVSARKYRLDNPDSYKAKSRRHNQSLKGRFNKYVNNSKGKREFKLTLNEFSVLTAQRCHYCNKFSHNVSYCGIDRIDNGIGYELANCVPCCKRCNEMKLDYTQEEWFTHMRDIMTHAQTITHSVK
jgi:hypothetical protein